MRPKSFQKERPYTPYRSMTGLDISPVCRIAGNSVKMSVPSVVLFSTVTYFSRKARVPYLDCKHVIWKKGNEPEHRENAYL